MTARTSARETAGAGVISLESVAKVHPGGVHAVRDVSLEVGRGELLGIVGASGSGKSTLLHLMGALDRPSSGTVRFEGRDVALLRDRELSALRAARIGFVFQRFHLATGVRPGRGGGRCPVRGDTAPGAQGAGRGRTGEGRAGAPGRPPPARDVRR
ncbi:ATP-binding cassette domain-containing protein [Nocardiopsis oceani]